MKKSTAKNILKVLIIASFPIAFMSVSVGNYFFSENELPLSYFVTDYSKEKLISTSLTLFPSFIVIYYAFRRLSKNKVSE